EAAAGPAGSGGGHRGPRPEEPAAGAGSCADASVTLAGFQESGDAECWALLYNQLHSLKENVDNLAKTRCPHGELARPPPPRAPGAAAEEVAAAAGTELPLAAAAEGPRMVLDAWREDVLRPPERRLPAAPAGAACGRAARRRR
ncbi:unnamed protein product, partial [Prorocentrum cordatum]